MSIYLYFKLFCGLFFMLIGISYLYKPDIIFRINKLLRETILNDSYVALFRIKIGLLFILIAFILLYISILKIL